MRFALLPVAAAALLLAACEDTKPTSGSAVTPTTNTTTPPAATGIRPGSAEDFRVNVGDRVFFAYDKFDLSADARRTLERQAAWLKQYASVRLTVEGHADERGTREYNLALGERRANAAKDYLVALGVPAARLTTVSYGKERPAVLGSNEAAWSQNRRSVSVPAVQ
ncbi:peptidoglycan-associated lipoprotein [Elstera cyanobacteriorum]|uniref:Peptidoglycan-associated lipoprotein n=1 Tax=Elstera cyanobacteriorum TaxID=2022747 RepID=A0A255XIM6_9PROT|nr:peptidoglycan-associated lipoprotein Pal [Elstera cyanobacteriorum]OYQ16741.1 peptidoglycan-associated lipoprotein [Elstera cyanobacteriorum]GFZ88231.1 peptidoglycan-associated lipoprotein [Elstera cyanobacteriorum]